MSVTVIEGDSREVLTTLPSESAQCCVTSPPYFGLRDYGNDGQIGLEATPDVYVAELVAVFREVRRVLKDDGTLWLNLGDSYARTGGTDRKVSETAQVGSTRNTLQQIQNRTTTAAQFGAKEKDLLGIPWRVAFALQADGWYLRSDIIWHKPNPMPESVTDRPTKAHEYVFLLSKSARYFYDAEAIAEQSVQPDRVRFDRVGGASHAERQQHSEGGVFTGAKSRNSRTVWSITTQPFKGAHFATMPPELARRCILAASRGVGKRCDCDETHLTPTGEGQSDDPTMSTGRGGMNRVRREMEGRRPVTRRQQRHHARELRESPFRDEMEAQAGPAFAHYIRTDISGARPIPPAMMDQWHRRGWVTDAPPCACPSHDADMILDPFGGAGTTGLVADQIGRNATLIELNPTYAAMARARIADDAPLFAEIS
jgi:DNA modification methylase